jgi:protein-disulfide isomerase
MQAAEAAMAADCAGNQDQYWLMHDLLFKDPKRLDRASNLERARTLALDMAAFSSCLDAEAKAKVDKDVAYAREIGVSVAPTLLIGHLDSNKTVRAVRKYNGGLSLDALSGAVEDLLRSAGR